MNAIAKILVIALACLYIGNMQAKEEKDLELYGARLGMTVTEMQALAKKKGRKIVGPGKGILDIDAQVQCSEYSVDRGRSLVSYSSISRQAFMVLNKKIIGVELHFKNSKAFKKFIEQLTKLGYTEKEKGQYEGALKTGDLAGCKVEIRVDQFKGGNKGKRMKYIINARCLEVLGKGVTIEKILKAQERKVNPKLKKDPKDALKGFF